MVENPPKDMPRVTPYLFYRDVAGALEWLARSFGFEKRFELPAADGGIMHAEMVFKDGVFMMGSPCGEQGSRSPVDLPGVNQSLYVYVDDVDAHYAHAKSTGAETLMEPTDMFWGDRMYSVKDIEGHQWGFAQHVRDVAPEDMEIPQG